MTPSENAACLAEPASARSVGEVVLRHTDRERDVERHELRGVDLEIVARQAERLEVEAAANLQLRGDRLPEGAAVGLAEQVGVEREGDLVDALRNKEAKLEDIETEKLPENMQKMKPAEQKAYLAKQQAKRDGITKQIKDISAKRAQFLKDKMAEMAKAAPGKPVDSFDGKVVETLHRQAAKKGITYEKK